MGPSKYIDPRQGEPQLTDDEYLLRTEFVRLYLHLRDPIDACLRLGFLAPYAKDWARAFMEEGLVRRLIFEAEISRDETVEKQQEVARLKALMNREATYYGPGSSHAARISAITQLMKLEGMEKPTETEVTHKGGVMVVPQLSTADDWSKIAAASQAKLKEDVRD